jgi:hypothetical protein
MSTPILLAELLGPPKELGRDAHRVDTGVTVPVGQGNAGTRALDQRRDALT